MNASASFLPAVEKCRMLLIACALFVLAACGREPEQELPVQVMRVDDACDVRQACTVHNGSLSLSVHLGPDMHALRPFPVEVRMANASLVQKVYVAFSMSGMDMGWNRYQLQAGMDDAWHASVTLPVCTSGRSDWIADFELITQRQRYRFQVPFVLEK